MISIRAAFSMAVSSIGAIGSNISTRCTGIRSKIIELASSAGRSTIAHAPTRLVNLAIIMKGKLIDLASFMRGYVAPTNKLKHLRAEFVHNLKAELKNVWHPDQAKKEMDPQYIRDLDTANTDVIQIITYTRPIRAVDHMLRSMDLLKRNTSVDLFKLISEYLDAPPEKSAAIADKISQQIEKEENSEKLLECITTESLEKMKEDYQNFISGRSRHTKNDIWDTIQREFYVAGNSA